MRNIILCKWHGSKDGDGNFCLNPSDYETVEEYKEAVIEFKALRRRILKEGHRG